MFEPTVETGFEYLKRIQQFTGVSYGEAELQLVYACILRGRSMPAMRRFKQILNEVSDLLAGLDIAGATSLLNSTAPSAITMPTATWMTNDYTVWRTKFGSSTILYGSGADGNYDGT